MLSQRLTMILNLISPCELLVDIGSDHGYLALAALQNGLAKTVIASDLREKPLIQAQKTFAQANVFTKVYFIRSDGLSAIQYQPDCVVIAGMGADLILKIVQQDLKRFMQVNQIITQTNTKNHILRQGMAQLGFQMQQEKIVFDGFYYSVQAYRYVGLCEELSESQTYFGYLLDQNDSVCLDYLENEKAKLSHILSLKPDSSKHLHLLNILNIYLNNRID